MNQIRFENDHDQMDRSENDIPNVQIGRGSLRGGGLVGSDIGPIAGQISKDAA
jgi:hypothetical protein